MICNFQEEFQNKQCVQQLSVQSCSNLELAIVTEAKIIPFHESVCVLWFAFLLQITALNNVHVRFHITITLHNYSNIEALLIVAIFTFVCFSSVSPPADVLLLSSKTLHRAINRMKWFLSANRFRKTILYFQNCSAEILNTNWSHRQMLCYWYQIFSFISLQFSTDIRWSYSTESCFQLLCIVHSR